MLSIGITACHEMNEKLEAVQRLARERRLYPSDVNNFVRRVNKAVRVARRLQAKGIPATVYAMIDGGAVPMKYWQRAETSSLSVTLDKEGTLTAGAFRSPARKVPFGDGGVSRVIVTVSRDAMGRRVALRSNFRTQGGKWVRKF